MQRKLKGLFDNDEQLKMLLNDIWQGCIVFGGIAFIMWLWAAVKGGVQ